MKNKKGVVIGKAITSVVTIIVVFVIMGAFAILAEGISVLKKPILLNENLILQPVQVNLNDAAETTTVLHVYILLENGKIEKPAFEKILESLLNEKMSCLALTQGKEPNFIENKISNDIDKDFFIKFKDGSYNYLSRKAMPNQFRLYHKQGKLSTTSFTNSKGETVYVAYYWGPCIDE